jgi:hypothetical protein
MHHEIPTMEKEEEEVSDGFYEEERFAGDTGRYPNFNIEGYLKEQAVEYRKHDSEDHNEFAINCPSCVERGEDREDTKLRLWVNPDRGAFYCYNCHWTGLLPRFIMKMSKVQYHDAIKILRGKDMDSLDHLNLKLFDEAVEFDDEDIELKEVEMPFGYEPIEGPHPYLEKRGVPWEYAADNDWGLCRVGYCKDRIIVPNYMNNKLVFWQARWAGDDGAGKDFKKVLNPKGVSARHVVFNFDAAKEFEEIVICEGFFDAVKVGPHAVATNGKKRQTNAKRVVIMWDLDAWTDSRKRRTGEIVPSSVDRAASLLKICFEVRAVKMPDKKDPGDYPYHSKELKGMIAMAEMI